MKTFARSHLFLGFLTVSLFAAGLFACDGSSNDDPPAGSNDAGPDTSPSTPDGGGDAAADGAQDAPADTDAASSPDASSQEKLICDAYASRSACSGGAIPCEADDKCIYGKVMLFAAAQVFATCRGAPSCKGDDFCVAQAGKSVGGAAADQYTQDCVARRTACNGSFKDDFCSPAVFAYPNAGPGAQACLAEPCDQINTCFANLQAIKDIQACK
jgi:hypothetical protein